MGTIDFVAPFERYKVGQSRDFIHYCDASFSAGWLHTEDAAGGFGRRMEDGAETQLCRPARQKQLV